jgi:TM2 domain-containing membrane protein YozV
MADASVAPAAGKSDKNKITALLLCIFLGGLGIHRFYVGKIGTGIVWLLTGGVFGIGWIVDIIMIAVDKFKDKQGNILS